MNSKDRKRYERMKRRIQSHPFWRQGGGWIVSETYYDALVAELNNSKDI